MGQELPSVEMASLNGIPRVDCQSNYIMKRDEFIRKLDELIDYIDTFTADGNDAIGELNRVLNEEDAESLASYKEYIVNKIKTIKESIESVNYFYRFFLHTRREYSTLCIRNTTASYDEATSINVTDGVNYSNIIDDIITAENIAKGIVINTLRELRE